jgi:hypothetical protein
VLVVLVAEVGLAEAADVFEPLEGLLACPKQSPARPRDNVAIINVFICMFYFLLVEFDLPFIPVSVQFEEWEGKRREDSPRLANEGAK